MKKTLSEFYGQGDYDNRQAKVTVDENGDYGVYYVIGHIEEYRFFPGCSIRYAEDAAENWVTGIIDPKDLIKWVD